MTSQPAVVRRQPRQASLAPTCIHTLFQRPIINNNSYILGLYKEESDPKWRGSAAIQRRLK